MHFSKTYSQLLLTLPPELQQNAIEYRQLKKLINKVVFELESLGLSPALLQELLQQNQNQQGELCSSSQDRLKGKQRAFGERPEELELGLSNPRADIGGEHTGSPRSKAPKTKVVYEVVKDGDHLQPRLRVWAGTRRDETPNDSPTSPSSSRIAIFLDNPGSPTTNNIDTENKSTGVSGNIISEDSDDRDENILLLSQPIVAKPGKSLIWTLQKRQKNSFEPESPESGFIQGLEPIKDGFNDLNDKPVPHPVELVKKHMRVSSDGTRELIIPLASDMAFFQLLYTALQSLTSHLHVVRQDFIADLERLASSISRTARPRSATSRDFHPLSCSSDPSSVTSPLLPLISPFSSSFVPGGRSKSDLYAWREIFQLYVEAEVFESMCEKDRGERDIIETEKRLAIFAEQVTGRGLSDNRRLKLKESRDALETFLQLNVLILNLKKFQFANAEAARKILKKHAKRTALHIPNTHTQTQSLVFGRDQLEITQDELLSLVPSSKSSTTTSLISLPHLLVQAISETLLPIIPHIDDYQCLICMSIAFKPVRLSCGHLFCVRCLVKMQKRGQDQCPCCRAPSVLRADRSNVDLAMINFMQDWFPRESALKLRQNEEEATREHLEELGIQDQNCIIC